MVNWGSIGGGALSGAATGSSFGPIGTAAGGTLGALLGWLSATTLPSNLTHGLPLLMAT